MRAAMPDISERTACRLLQVSRSALHRLPNGKRARATLSEKLVAQLEPLIQADGERLLAAIGTPDVLPLLLSAASGVHPMDACLDVAVPALFVALDHAAVRPAEPLRHHRAHRTPRLSVR